MRPAGTRCAERLTNEVDRIGWVESEAPARAGQAVRSPATMPPSVRTSPPTACFSSAYAGVDKVLSLMLLVAITHNLLRWIALTS